MAKVETTRPGSQMDLTFNRRENSISQAHEQRAHSAKHRGETQCPLMLEKMGAKCEELAEVYVPLTLPFSAHRLDNHVGAWLL